MKNQWIYETVTSANANRGKKHEWRHLVVFMNESKGA